MAISTDKTSSTFEHLIYISPFSDTVQIFEKKKLKQKGTVGWARVPVAATVFSLLVLPGKLCCRNRILLSSSNENLEEKQQHHHHHQQQEEERGETKTKEK